MALRLGMVLDHIGIAVRSIEATAARLCLLTGYVRHTAVVENSRQQVRVQFLSKPGSLSLKLIEPAGDSSPLHGFLRRGEGLHHLCFRVGNVAEDLDRLAAAGVRVLAAPAPGEAFDDHLITFCYLGSGLNVELIDTDVRRALLDSI